MTSLIKHNLKIILSYEGGFVNSAIDNGGPTNFGLSTKFLEKYYNRSISIKDMKNLTIQDAKDIYIQEFYLRPRIDELPHVVRLAVMDCAIHSGSKKAIKILQTSINEIFALYKQDYTPLIIDGINGSKTIRASHFYQNFTPSIYTDLIAQITDCRKTMLLKIIQNSPSQEAFWEGWHRRVDEIYTHSLDILNKFYTQ